MTPFFKEFTEEKRKFEYVEKQYNKLIDYYKEIYKKGLNYSDSSKADLNKLSARDKKNALLYIYFGINNQHVYDNLMGNSSNDSFLPNISVYFYYDAFGYDINPGLIVDLSNEREVHKLFRYVYTEELWRQEVINQNTKLGYNTWYTSMDNFEVKEKDGTYKIPCLYSINKIYHTSFISVPELFDGTYFIIYKK